MTWLCYCLVSIYRESRGAFYYAKNSGNFGESEMERSVSIRSERNIFVHLIGRTVRTEICRSIFKTQFVTPLLGRFSITWGIEEGKKMAVGQV